MVVINLHQLKAAGKSLEGIFYREYGEKGTCYISKVKPKSECFPIAEYGKKLDAMDESEMKDIRLITGHMFYGIHNHFESNCRYISMVRNPVERLISYYYYLLKTDEIDLSRVLRKNKVTLKEFVSLEKNDIEALNFEEHSAFQLEYMLENGQCKFLSGLNPSLGESSKIIYDKALENVDSYFTTVGITERFDESILLMGKLLNWRFPIFYTRANVTREKRGDKKEVGQDVVDLISRRNEWDIKLYQKMSTQFIGQFNENIRYPKWELLKLNALSKLFSFYIRAKKVYTV